MKTFRGAFAALALAGAGLIASPMAAPAAAAVDTSDPQKLIATLTSDGFAALRTGDKATAKSRFRALMAQNVAVTEIGSRLIRRWLPTISPAQKAAYDAALPSYIIGTYTDRLFEYANASVKILRAQPTAGDGVDVYSQVIKPGSQPIPTVWSVTKADGAWKVLNLRVGGINVAMAQAADFDSVIQRQGFDALIKMMKARG